MAAMITTPRLMYVGGGALDETGACCAKLDLERVLIVTDPVMVEIGKLAQVTERLEAAGVDYDVFSDTVPEPTDGVVEVGAAMIQNGAFDGLVALGGGSPIDTAKAMNILAAGGGAMRDYKVPHQADLSVLPLIAIPTTAGTGSEVTRFTVITDEASDEKMLITGLACLPDAAIVDYTLTLTVPFRTTADTGIDSLTHAMEAYVSKKASPYTDALALSAMERLYTHIRTACFEPENETARAEMMLGATQAGMAFSNASVALVHGMSRPMGAHFHVPHGLSNAMLLPAVTRFSAPAALERYAQCARTMGLAEDSEGAQAACARLVEALEALNRELQVPSPAEFGIEEARFRELMPLMAEQALASGSPGNNPRVPSAEEIISIYEEVWT